jgi:hypothetical protein
LALASQLAIVADAVCGFNSYGFACEKGEEAGSAASFEKFASEELSQDKPGLPDVIRFLDASAFRSGGVDGERRMVGPCDAILLPAASVSWKKAPPSTLECFKQSSCRSSNRVSAALHPTQLKVHRMPLAALGVRSIPGCLPVDPHLATTSPKAIKI